MTFNIDLIQKYYKTLPEKIHEIRQLCNRPLTFTEKILFSHLFTNYKNYKRGTDYAEFSLD